MFGADGAGTSPHGILHGNFHSTLCAGGKTLCGIGAGQSGTNAFFENFNHHAVSQTGFGENLMCNAVFLTDQTEEQMFRTDVTVTEFSGGLLRKTQSFFCTGGELIFIHRSKTFLSRVNSSSNPMFSGVS